MAKKGYRTETAPMEWDTFQTLLSKLAYDIDHKIKDDIKRKQETKFLLLLSLVAIPAYG